MPDSLLEQQADIEANYSNVQEVWPLVDTAVVCSQFYGQESSNKGWFTNFRDFAQTDRHVFFKDRTEASASLAYSNKQSADTMDFMMVAYSFGVAFIAPGVRALCADAFGSNAYSAIASQIAHWWEVELPNHCSIELTIQQDKILEAPCMAMSPGYGPCGSGTSFENEQAGRSQSQGTPTSDDYLPVANMAVTQGVPQIKNRWPFPQGVGIPRTSTIEAVITLSDFAKHYLTAMFPLNPQYVFGGIDGAPLDPSYNIFPARFMIQVSLLGMRGVQQRGQLHR